MKKLFDSESLYNEKYLKTKLKFYEGKINTNVYGENVPKESSQCIWLPVTLIGSVF